MTKLVTLIAIIERVGAILIAKWKNIDLKGIKKIYQSDKTLTFADKSSNMYRLTKEKYVKMRRSVITATYKKTKRQTATWRKKLTLKEKQIMENVDKEILGRMDMSSKNTCFITLKDHKENFLNNPTVD